MTLNRMGLKIVTLAAVLTLAACDKTPETDVKNQTAMDAGESQATKADENFNDVKGKGDVSSDTLAGSVSPFLTADQAGLEQYTGSDRVFFTYDSDVLTSDARNLLQKQAAWLKHHSDVSIVIEGHADERGTRDYNLALGERRALAVKNYLQALDVAATRMTTISYGKERPEVDGNGESYWSQNRRSVVVVQ